MARRERPTVSMFDIRSFEERAPSIVANLASAAPGSSVCLLTDAADARLLAECLVEGATTVLPRTGLQLERLNAGENF